MYVTVEHPTTDLMQLYIIAFAHADIEGHVLNIFLNKEVISVLIIPFDHCELDFWWPCEPLRPACVQSLGQPSHKYHTSRKEAGASTMIPLYDYSNAHSGYGVGLLA